MTSLLLLLLLLVVVVVVRHEWGVLGTASAAFLFSLHEGNRAPRVAVQSRGQETLTVRYTYLQLGNPAI